MSFNDNLSEVASTFVRKKPSRPGRRNTKKSGVMGKISELLKDINPVLAAKFASIEKGGVKFKAGSELADNVKSTSPSTTRPARKTVKFKAGSELADNVKSTSPEGGRTVGAGQVIDIVESAGPADVKKLADELVNLTVKEENETSTSTDTKEDNTETSESDAITSDSK